MARLSEVRQEPEMREPKESGEPVPQGEWWANPAVVGLMGFATTTMATGLADTGLWGNGAILALAVAFGGSAQFVAGVVDLRKGNLFGGSAMMAYGAFWWSLFVLDYVLPARGITVTHRDLVGYFSMWSLFTLSFFAASLRVSVSMSVLFGMLLLAFLLIAGAAGGAIPAAVAGVVTFLTGAVAWYIASAMLINHVYGRKVLWQA